MTSGGASDPAPGGPRLPGSRRSSSAPARLSVLVLSFTDLARDPRVDRQIRFLAEEYRVVAAGTGPPRMGGVEFVRLATEVDSLRGRILRVARLSTRRYERHYWRSPIVRRSLARLSGLRPDLVLANDIDALPLALRLADGAPVVFDAHEYAPREFEDRLTFRLLHRPYRDYLCRAYVPRVRAMMTVGRRIAAEYERDTGVRPVVVWNAPDYVALEPSPPTADRFRLVHHGGTQRSRRLEQMIRVMHHLDGRFELDLLLVGHDEAYLRLLRAEARGDPRIRFRKPVPMRALPAFLNRFDVGIFLLPPVNFNYRFALPNKLFEFVQARLAIAIGPSPEMAELVTRHELGLVAPDFRPASLAACLSALTPERLQSFKANAHRAARELSAASGRERILGLVREALAGTA